MKVLYRPRLFTRAYTRYKYIIIHDTTCTFQEYSEFYKDNAKSQINQLRTLYFALTGEYELNYHYVVERTNQDFETMVARPLNTFCLYDDIPSPFDKSIHICLLGSYELTIPIPRFYQQLAYRSIVPMMAWFRIPITSVLLHSDIVKDSQCPGRYFDKSKLNLAIKEMWVAK